MSLAQAKNKLDEIESRYDELIAQMNDPDFSMRLSELYAGRERQRPKSRTLRPRTKSTSARWRGYSRRGRDARHGGRCRSGSIIRRNWKYAKRKVGELEEHIELIADAQRPE